VSPQSVSPDLKFESASFVAAGRLCKQVAPNIHFASQFLSKPRRYAVYCTVGLYRQLRRVVESGSQECQQSDCSADPVQRSREICTCIIDSLYAFEPCGQNELDGFAGAVRVYDLPRQPWDTLLEAVTAEPQIKRYATWNRLQEQFQHTAGAFGQIMMPLFFADPKVQTNQTLLHQIQAWCSAMRLIVALLHVPKHWKQGRLYLPQDDLVRFGLSERDIERFVKQGSAGADSRWEQLVAFEVDRVSRLFQGAGKALTALDGDRCRRAVAVHGMIYAGWLDRWRKAGADSFARDWKIRFGDRFKGLTRGCLLAAGLTDPAKMFQ